MMATPTMCSRVLLLCSMLAACAGCSDSGESSVTRLASDERVVFITTDAHLSKDGQTWTIPIHAWVHEPESSRIRKRAIAEVLSQKYGLGETAETEHNFDRRIQLFLVDNERDKTIVVRMLEQTYVLPPTKADGHAHTEIKLEAKLVPPPNDDGEIAFSAELPEIDNRNFSGRVRLVGPSGISVISDIDDTVKVTQVTDRVAMLDRTFFQDFEAVAGMAQLYQRLADRDATFHFVSSSPWQLYEPLDEFMTANNFPPRSMSLKSVRLKDRTIQNLFETGLVTKPIQIEPILRAYPQRRFILVGDSGEHDPEAYALIMKKHPQQIERVWIRNVTDASTSDARFEPLLAETDAAKWTLFTDPAMLELPD